MNRASQVVKVIKLRRTTNPRPRHGHYVQDIHHVIGDRNQTVGGGFEPRNGRRAIQRLSVGPYKLCKGPGGHIIYLPKTTGR
jgi:hypothetical protein